MSSAVSLEQVGVVLGRHLTSLGLSLTLVDEDTGEIHSVRVETAQAVDGALPIFLAAADAIWREATGRTIGMEMTEDPASLLGVAVAEVNGAPYSVVMLCLLEAIERAADRQSLVINDLNRVAELARNHSLQAAA